MLCCCCGTNACGCLRFGDKMDESSLRIFALSIYIFIEWRIVLLPVVIVLVRNDNKDPVVTAVQAKHWLCSLCCSTSSRSMTTTDISCNVMVNNGHGPWLAINPFRFMMMDGG